MKNTGARDEKRFGVAKLETINIIENFCSMHLGVNLRKAFLSGIVSELSASGEREYHPIDIFVHEFTKLFGKYGTPEYGLGSISFPDFLALMCTDANEISNPFILSVLRHSHLRASGWKSFCHSCKCSQNTFPQGSCNQVFKVQQ